MPPPPPTHAPRRGGQPNPASGPLELNLRISEGALLAQTLNSLKGSVNDAKVALAAGSSQRRSASPEAAASQSATGGGLEVDALQFVYSKRQEVAAAEQQEDAQFGPSNPQYAGFFGEIQRGRGDYSAQQHFQQLQHYLGAAGLVAPSVTSDSPAGRALINPYSATPHSRLTGVAIPVARQPPPQAYAPAPQQPYAVAPSYPYQPYPPQPQGYMQQPQMSYGYRPY